MDPELTEDDATEARLEPTVHAAKQAGRVASKSIAAIVGVALLVLLAIFVVLGLITPVIVRPA